MAAPQCTDDDASMIFHCEQSAMCEWWTCPECGTVYDLQRGIRILRSGAVETWAVDG